MKNEDSYNQYISVYSSWILKISLYMSINFLTFSRSNVTNYSSQSLIVFLSKTPTAQNYLYAVGIFGSPM